MTVCAACGFVFNATFDATKLQYGEHYDNSQICSPFFEDYVDTLVHQVVGRVHGRSIVEIGCGKGYFLKKLVSSDPESTGLGYDSTYEGPASDLEGRLQFRREFFDGQALPSSPGAVVCRHVIEHVPDPAAMLRSVRSSLPSDSDALVFFETPALEWILDHDVIWDFFYEHCSLFTAASLSRAFRAAGFVVDRVERVFDGQYLWLEARVGAAGPEPATTGSDVAAQCAAFGRRWESAVADWRRRVVLETRRVAVWGAGAKGVTFVNLVDPEGTLIDCVVDVNPRKQGAFIAGSAHPIVSPAELRDRGVSVAILMNPNYEAENRRLLAELGLDVELVCG